MNLSKKQDRILIGGLLVVTLIFHLLTQQLIDNGPDNVDYWYFAKLLGSGTSFGELFHRNVRWGIIIPLALFQKISGNSLLVYYFVPLFFSLFVTCGSWIAMKELTGSKKAFIATLALIFFPQMIRQGSQLLLGLVSLAYILFSFYFLLKYCKEEKGKIFFVVVSALLFFASYLTKITNLWLLPGFFFLLYYRTKSLKKLFLYAGILLFFYFIEHVSYIVFAGEKLGRLGIIVQGHLDPVMNMQRLHEFSGTFFGLFRRLSLKHFPIYWLGVFVLWVSSQFFIIRKPKEFPVKELSVLTISFFVLLMFGIKSINPIIPFEPFRSRYWLLVLPFWLIMITELFFRISSLKLFHNIFGKRSFFHKSLYLEIGLIFLLLLASSLPLPISAWSLWNSPLKLKEHKVVLTLQSQKKYLEAESQETLIYSIRELPDGWIENKEASNFDVVHRIYLQGQANGEKWPTRVWDTPDGGTIVYIDFWDGDEDIVYSKWIDKERRYISKLFGQNIYD